MKQTAIFTPSTESIVGFLRVQKRLSIPEWTCLYQLMAVLYVTLL